MDQRHRERAELEQAAESCPDISRSDRDRRPEPEAEQHSEQRAEMQCPVTNTPHTPYKIHTVTAYITRYTDAKT